MKKRLAWIDWAKFIFITLVCVGHFGPPEIQKQLIWGCHMPAFFIISGYLYHRRNAWQTFLSLFVPIVFFSVICYILYIVESYIKTGTCDATSHFYYRALEEFIFRNENNPYQRITLYMGSWFIIAFLGCRFLAGDIKFFSFTLKFKYWILGFLLIFLGLQGIILNDKPFQYIRIYNTLYAFPFFLIGYILKEKSLIENLKIWQIIVLLVIYTVTSISLPRFDMMSYTYYPNYLVFFFNAICGSIALFWICQKLPQNHIIQILATGTLLILPLHKHIQFFTLPIFHRIGITPNLTQHIVPWLVVFIVMFVCYFPIKWLNNHHPILLGKLPKKNNFESKETY